MLRVGVHCHMHAQSWMNTGAFSNTDMRRLLKCTNLVDLAPGPGRHAVKHRRQAPRPRLGPAHGSP